jgi:predicted RNA polymerase sigma factor
MNDRIRRFTDGLPDSYRSALILHDLEGLGAEQVAEICERSVATAKIRIHRARRRLREKLGPVRFLPQPGQRFPLRPQARRVSSALPVRVVLRSRRSDREQHLHNTLEHS